MRPKAKAPKVRKIRVGDIAHPVYCFKQHVPTKPPFRNAMARCIFDKGHDGPHSWEPGAKVQEIR